MRRPAGPAAEDALASSTEAAEDRVVRAVAEALGADVAALVVPGDGTNARVAARWPHDPAVTEVALEGSALPRAASGAAPVLADADPALGLLLGGGAGPAGGIAVPLDAAEGPPPLLCCVVREPRTFSRAEEGLVAAYARALALGRSLERERAAGEATAARLASLVDAGMALAGELSLDDLLSRLVRTAREVLGARYAALGVLNEDRTELASFVTAGLDEAQREAIGELPRGRGILGALIRDARPLRLESISDDPRSVGFPPNHPAMESFLGVPVALRGEAFGNLYITEKVGGPFTEEDEQMAQTLAAQAAVAVDNARRYEAERRRADELESVQELARAVLATLELDQLLPLVARRARRLTGADTVGVGLREDEAMVFRYAHGTRALALESLSVPADPAGLPEELRSRLGASVVEVADLRVGDELAGVVCAVGDSSFDEAARRLLDTFSSHAAIALSNARAVAEERKRLLLSAEVQAARARERSAAEGLRRAIEAQEAERSRIALELHDEAGQVLTALALHVRALETYVAPEGREQLAEIRALANSAASSMRDMATRLRPSGLREHGLASALERQAARVQASGVRVDLAVEGLPAGLPEEVEIAIFRVVQEALTNVARHSGADQASVLATGHGGRLRVVVEDDGRGFDPSAPTDRLGIAGLRERVELLGGTLRIESAPGAGTAVIVDLEVPT